LHVLLADAQAAVGGGDGGEVHAEVARQAAGGG
jgi:hypothetical protein